jgi:hypothetical protein
MRFDDKDIIVKTQEQLSSYLTFPEAEKFKFIHNHID